MEGCAMRGADGYNEALFTTIRLEEFVPANHPLRPIRTWLNQALANMDARFSAMYEADVKGGRPSIAPEKLMRAMLLQVLYSIRSERLLVEQISYNLLFRWFVGLAIEDPVWNHSVFSKNRDRLITLMPSPNCSIPPSRWPPATDCYPVNISASMAP
jgi:transposase